MTKSAQRWVLAGVLVQKGGFQQGFQPGFQRRRGVPTRFQERVLAQKGVPARGSSRGSSTFVSPFFPCISTHMPLLAPLVNSAKCLPRWVGLHRRRHPPRHHGGAPLGHHHCPHPPNAPQTCCQKQHAWAVPSPPTRFMTWSHSCIQHGSMETLDVGLRHRAARQRLALGQATKDRRKRHCMFS